MQDVMCVVVQRLLEAKGHQGWSRLPASEDVLVLADQGRPDYTPQGEVIVQSLAKQVTSIRPVVSGSASELGTSTTLFYLTCRLTKLFYFSSSQPLCITLHAARSVRPIGLLRLHTAAEHSSIGRVAVACASFVLSFRGLQVVHTCACQLQLASTRCLAGSVLPNQ